MDKEQIIRDFAAVINRHSLENESDTPDRILAEFLYDTLQSFNKTVVARRDWYGLPNEWDAKLQPLGVN